MSALSWKTCLRCSGDGREWPTSCHDENCNCPGDLHPGGPCPACRASGILIGGDPVVEEVAQTLVRDAYLDASRQDNVTLETLDQLLALAVLTVERAR